MPFNENGEYIPPVLKGERERKNAPVHKQNEQRSQIMHNLHRSMMQDAKRHEQRNTYRCDE